MTWFHHLGRGIPLFILVGLSMNCGGKDGGGSGAEDDTGYSGPPTGIAGSKRIVQHATEWDDGTGVLCDLEVTFTGTPYTGECTGCDFAFATTVVETNWFVGGGEGDSGVSEDCYRMKYLALEGGSMSRLMAFARDYTGKIFSWGRAGQEPITVSNAFLIGNSSQYYYGDWYIFGVYDEPATATWEGSAFTVEAYINGSGYEVPQLDFSLSATLTYE